MHIQGICISNKGIGLIFTSVVQIEYNVRLKFFNHGTFLVFLVIALIAAVFGFGGIAAGAGTIAKILFFIFLILFIFSLLVRAFR